MSTFSTGAYVFLIAEFVFFIFLIYSIKSATGRAVPLMSLLSKSLRISEDLFGDERNLVTSARTRYKRAAERIEDVDAHAIAAGELSSFEAVRIGKLRLSLAAITELAGSAPGVFVTIGLLGTFVGLVLNLGELGSILNMGNGSDSAVTPGALVQQLGGILAPMSTAFVSSLGGVFFSLLYWLVALLMGANRIFEDLESLLTAYLEQVVQADCNRYSLLKASVQNMELCLAEFMSKFGERVGAAIENALNRKISDVFDSIKQGGDALVKYANVMDEGAKQMTQSGNAFYKAAVIFDRSSFASDFSRSVSSFLSASDQLSSEALALSENLNALIARSEIVESSLTQAADSITASSTTSQSLVSASREQVSSMMASLAELVEANKQLRAARLAVGKENKTSDQLSRALIEELQSVRPGKDEIANLFNAVLEQMQERTIIDSRLAELIERNLRVEGLSDTQRSKLNLLLNTLTVP